MNRSGNTTATGHKGLAAGLVHRNDRRVAHEAAEVGHLAHALAFHRDYTHGGGLLVDHANGGLVGDDAGDGGCGGVARNGNHVKADGAYAGHSLELFDLQAAVVGRVDHVLVFGDRNERAGQAAHIGGRHDAALLHLVVEHGERGGGAWGAHLFEADLLQHFADGVAHGGGRGEREVDDAEWHSESAGGLLGHQLADARDLERGALDGFAQEFEVFALGLVERAGDHAGAGNADVDDRVTFGHAVEAACHERVVVRGVAERHELHATVGIIVCGGVRDVLDDVAEQFDGVHVDAGFGGAHVHGGANDVGFGQGLRQGADEHFLSRGHGLGHERGVAANQVDADLLGRAVERVRDLDEILGALAGACADQGNRGDSDALVDDRDAEIAFDGLAGGHEVLGVHGDLVVDVLADLVDAVGCAIQQADAHGDGAHVELLLLDHLVGLVDLHDIQHGFSLRLVRFVASITCVTYVCRGSDAVHLGEDLFALAADAHADLLAELVEIVDDCAEFLVRVGIIHNHHHVEEAVDDGL